MEENVDSSPVKTIHDDNLCSRNRDEVNVKVNNLRFTSEEEQKNSIFFPLHFNKQYN